MHSSSKVGKFSHQKNLPKKHGQILSSKLWPIVAIWDQVWRCFFLRIFRQHMGLNRRKTFKSRFLAILEIFVFKLWDFQRPVTAKGSKRQRGNLSNLIVWNLLNPIFDILRLTNCRKYGFFAFFWRLKLEENVHFILTSFFLPNIM